jgi:predicted ATP-grasp superfamily ATP-dependent carboligase
LPVERPAVVLGLLWAGLSFARSLGRRGVPVSGITMHPHEFGTRSRYLDEVHRAQGDKAVLKALRAAAQGDVKPVLLPERDDHVELVLRHWDEVSELYELPMPPDPEVPRRLRHKATLPLEAERAGLAAPRTVEADSLETLQQLDLRPPFLLKPVEGQHFAGAFGEKVMVAQTLDQLTASWKRARERGFDTVVQELVPDAEHQIWSLFAYIGRSGWPLATATGVKVRQGPIRFGTSAVFRTTPKPRVRELGLQLLESSGYRGFGHVEFAYDRRDGDFKLLEVNTRVPMWAGVAMTRHFDMARIAYDDLCGKPEPEPADLQQELWWSFFAKDLAVSLQMARRRELTPAGWARPYLQKYKVRGVFAADDPLPALGVPAYARSKIT